MNSEDVHLRRHYRAVRTPKGHQAVKSDLRVLPRRLRVLLLAIDGKQTVDLYVQTLRGFGDVPSLIGELVDLDLLQLQLPPAPRPAPTQAQETQGDAGDSLFSTPPDSSMLEQRFLDTGQLQSDSLMNALYDSTFLGPLEGMTVTEHGDIPVLTSEIDATGLQTRPVARTSGASIAGASATPSAANDAISADDQNEQIKSLFNLLEQTRNDRYRLKTKLHKYRVLHDKVLDLQHENDVLRHRSTFLGRSVVALLAVIVVGGVWAAIRV
jgi:hypothetical protein